MTEVAMADPDDTARAAVELTVYLPPAPRLMSLTEMLDALSKGHPDSRAVWQLRVTNAVRVDRLRVRYESGLSVEAGTIGAHSGMGTHFLSSDVAAWLQTEGWAVTFAESVRKQVRAVPISTQHEQAILREIKALGLDPLALPAHVQGKAGPKANVRKRLSLSRSAFDKAWERLRSDGELRESPTSK
ncbi:hypothetical protein BG58_04915 [Caballeronia jiangsuensis]|nr:hypothetical protein BG58_04915 [Caballeronia jiangsuensis]